MKRSLIFFSLLLGEHALAQDKPQPREMEMCKVQIELYCQFEREQKDFREILKCLAKNDDKLSTECKQEFQRFAQASRQTTPPGGGPLGALGGLTGLGSQAPSLFYEGRFIQGSNDSPETPSFLESNLNTSVPVFKTEKNTVAVTLGGGNLHLSEPVILSSGTKVSTNFYKADVGLQYSRSLENKRRFGLLGSVGYSGDKLDTDTQSFNVSANYSFPGSNDNQWVLMVMMSNNSPLGTFVPVPGFFYIYRTSTFTGLFGLPILSIQWTPVNPWSFSFSVFGPTLKTEVAYGEIDKTQFFTGFGWKQQRYLLSERTNKDERLTIEEKNAEIGFRRPLFQGVFSEFQTGYTFDRSIYLGEGLFNKDGGSADLDSSWYLKWSVKVTF
ncbi:MAG: hypothetical protein JNM39_13655 [Bdellovibrionaceae bacterium]|nr:hypothetical protein [Pseudobdellovibrionaceae bacterium]